MGPQMDLKGFPVLPEFHSFSLWKEKPVVFLPKVPHLQHSACRACTDPGSAQQQAVPTQTSSTHWQVYTTSEHCRAKRGLAIIIFIPLTESSHTSPFPFCKSKAQRHCCWSQSCQVPLAFLLQTGAPCMLGSNRASPELTSPPASCSVLHHNSQVLGILS